MRAAPKGSTAAFRSADLTSMVQREAAGLGLQCSRLGLRGKDRTDVQTGTKEEPVQLGASLECRVQVVDKMQYSHFIEGCIRRSTK